MGWNSTHSDLLSLDPPPKCLTCGHQSTTIMGCPKDTEMRRRSDNCENEIDNLISATAKPHLTVHE